MILSILILLFNIIHLKFKITDYKIVIYLISLIHFSFFCLIHINDYFFCYIIKLIKHCLYYLGLIPVLIFLLIFGFDVGLVFLIYHFTIIVFLLSIIPFHFFFIKHVKPFDNQRNIEIHQMEYDFFLKFALIIVPLFEFDILELFV